MSAVSVATVKPVVVEQVDSEMNPDAALLDVELPAGEAWMGLVHQGQRLRIVDLEGNQTVNALFYSAKTFEERYSVTDTLRSQANAYLRAGSPLLSNEGNVMALVIADTCGRHDTMGGACSAESNTVLFAAEKRHMHSCRDNFLMALSRADCGLTKRDLAGNVSFFSQLPVGPGSQMTVSEGSATPGRYVELEATMELIVLLSNCPQMNDSSNGYNPTPVRVLVWDTQEGELHSDPEL